MVNKGFLFASLSVYRRLSHGSSTTGQRFEPRITSLQTLLKTMGQTVISTPLAK